jgi:hypothetical protein
MSVPAGKSDDPTKPITTPAPKQMKKMKKFRSFDGHCFDFDRGCDSPPSSMSRISGRLLLSPCILAHP